MTVSQPTASATIGPESLPPPDSKGRWHKWQPLLSLVILLSANALILANIRLPFIRPALGFWALVVYPTYLLLTSSLFRASSRTERLGYSAAVTLLGLMLTGLVANTFLPMLGVKRPLDTVPVMLVADLLVTSAYVVRWVLPDHDFAIPSVRSLPRSLRPPEGWLLLGSALSVGLAILGANRLNNGAGDQVSLAAVCLGGAVLVILLRWHKHVADGATAVIIYLLSLSLLLMTSLRGWSVTGHDIQREFQVFQLTAGHGRWDISTFHNTYNACLSLTILPTEFWRVINVDSPYIYKVFFQLIFAMCPVLVYTIVRRYWRPTIAILCAVYFISFPTFFNDMPFLNRQEIALIFVCVAVLAITNTLLRVRQRQIAMIIACIGIEVSHYSTMYLFIGTIAVAWSLSLILRLTDRRRRTGGAHAAVARWADTTQVAGVVPILGIVVIIVAWGLLATQTVSTVVVDAESSVSAFFGHSAAQRSGDVSYSLFFWRSPSPQIMLNEYSRHLLDVRASSPADFLPNAVVSEYPIHAVSQPLLPLTSVGRLFSDVGVPVAAANESVRLASAYGEQAFVLVGFLSFLFIPRLKRQVSREYFCLCAGSICALAVVTVFPGLSVEYGVLRVFQGALILLAPMLVIGGDIVLQHLGQKWAPRAAAAACMAIFVSTTGLLPQLLGGYPGQLNLDNFGPYYDTYYTHPQEISAVDWLGKQPDVLPTSVQAPYLEDRFAFTSSSDVSGKQFISDAFPLFIHPDSWMILSYSVLRTDRATALYNGNLITYNYPIGLLRNNKDLVYNNGGTEIFK